MARQVVLTLGNETSAFDLTRVDREKLYGRQRRVVVDDEGNPCERGLLSEDGSVLLPPGATATLLVTGEFAAGTASVAFDGTLVATGTPDAVPGDMNADGSVDGADLGALLRVWGQAHPVADFTGDGTVDGRDLAYMLAHWTR